MKTIILYFTGTGNSLYIAKRLNEQIEKSELLSISNEKTLNIKTFKNSKIFIIFPVYAFGIPTILYQFLKTIKFENCLITSIQNSAGKHMPANRIIKKLTCNKNTKFYSSYSILMPNNYIPMKESDSDEKIDTLFKNADEKIKEIIKNDNHEKQKFENGSYIFYLLSKPAMYFFKKGIKTMAKNYFTNDKCNSCGICQKLCPVNNIELKTGKPQWNNKCLMCMGCLQNCPQNAIEYGNTSINRKRYKNPLITTSEIIKNRNNH